MDFRRGKEEFYKSNSLIRLHQVNFPDSTGDWVLILYVYEQINSAKVLEVQGNANSWPIAHFKFFKYS